MTSEAKSLLHELVERGRAARDLALKQADLRGQRLAGLRADGLDLDEADLRTACFADAHWTGCTLRDARLDAADFTDAVLRMCDLDGVRGSEALFVRAHLENGSARGARFDGARFEAAVLTDTDFSRASLRGAILEGASASGADFRGADLRDARLGRAVLIDSDLRGADLTGADLTGADLHSPDVRGVVGLVLARGDEERDQAGDEPPTLPADLRAMSDMMTPIVQEVLRTAGRRGVIDPDTARRLVEDAARLHGAPAGGGPSVDTLRAVTRVLEGFGGDVLPKLLSALHQPNDEGPTAEIQALIRNLSRELSLGDATSAEDVLERLRRGSGRPSR
jgi:uncharacterized protein YjbI with pentapeptide repeats